jgi:GT2 family glycosyltransferase
VIASGSIPAVGVVVLTQGKRPDGLAAAIASIQAQTGISSEVVVVGNGWDPARAEPPLPVGVKTVALPHNLGIPDGRNAGVGAVGGDVLFFLDDDAAVPASDFLATGCAMLAADPTLGLIQPRVVDPTRGTSRHWIPRMRKRQATTSGNVFSCWEGCILMPRSVFDAAGGWAKGFFYAHEGIELAWRVWDQDRRAWYAGDLVANHPVIEQTRHAEYYRLNARNRVWLARRNLPALLMPAYVGSWTAVQLVRWMRHPRRLRTWFSGWWEGWRTDPGERRPIRWRTVWRMTVAGRPPIV